MIFEFLEWKTPLLSTIVFNVSPTESSDVQPIGMLITLFTLEIASNPIQSAALLTMSLVSVNIISTLFPPVLGLNWLILIM